MHNIKPTKTNIKRRAKLFRLLEEDASIGIVGKVLRAFCLTMSKLDLRDTDDNKVPRQLFFRPYEESILHDKEMQDYLRIVKKSRKKPKR